MSRFTHGKIRVSPAVYMQVRLQMEVLLEACSGRGNATNFVSVVWAAIVSRLRSDEASGTTESPNGSSNSEEETKEERFKAEQKEEGPGDDGWEEHKGEERVAHKGERQRLRWLFSRHGSRKKTPEATTKDGTTSAVGKTDVALLASGERQLRVSGTLRRAIQASVSTCAPPFLAFPGRRWIFEPHFTFRYL